MKTINNISELFEYFRFLHPARHFASTVSKTSEDKSSQDYCMVITSSPIDLVKLNDGLSNAFGGAEIRNYEYDSHTTRYNINNSDNKLNYAITAYNDSSSAMLISNNKELLEKAFGPLIDTLAETKCNNTDGDFSITASINCIAFADNKTATIQTSQTKTRQSLIDELTTTTRQMLDDELNSSYTIE